jgi:hypothetical protein
VLLKDVTGWAYMNLPARAAAKQANSPYQGLTPNSSAITTPMAGYQATNPMREKKMTSDRFSNRYNNTNKMEIKAWRKIKRRECMKQISAA